MTTQNKIDNLNLKADALAERASILEKKGDNVGAMNCWIEEKKLVERIENLELLLTL